MSVENNRKAIETLWQRFEQELDWAVVEQAYDPAYTRHVANADVDRATWFEQLQELYRAFPGHHTEVTITVAEGDLVAYQWQATATHADTYYGAPATGRSVQATGVSIIRLRDGRIVEEWASWDKYAFLSDLKILSLRP